MGEIKSRNDKLVKQIFQTNTSIHTQFVLKLFLAVLYAVSIWVRTAVNSFSEN